MKDVEKNITISIKARKILIKKLIFLKLLLSKNIKPIVIFEIAYKKVAKKVIKKVLITLLILKVLGIDKFNFLILYIV